ncbi:Testis-expressed protein 14 [Tupaia chinensis]|uniref:Testis-expressed protein 14 n=1 Tax=Tupaia chinensis TaxID=246437 RepID=L8XZ91_TUPCH|nr:Testis-expressed protein 14 [Tupaia chinensis]
MARTLLDRRGSSSRRCWAAALPCSSCLLLAPTPTSDRCLDGSTPVHAGAFSGRSLVMLHLLQAGGDLRLHDQQGCTPRDWAEQGGAKQSWEVLELLQLCRAHMSALVHGAELAPTASLGWLRACSRHGLRGSLSPLGLVQADRTLRSEQIRSSPQIPVLGFGQLSSLWPLGLVMGIPLADPKELLPAQGEPDRAYESSSHTRMANLLWRGHPVTVRQLKAPRTQPDVLLADLQHCRMDLLEEIMAELQSGCQLRGKLSPGPSPGLDSHGSLSADTASQNLPETSSQ